MTKQLAIMLVGLVVAIGYLIVILTAAVAGGENFGVLGVVLGLIAGAAVPTIVSKIWIWLEKERS
jgi:hypothetical protein